MLMIIKLFQNEDEVKTTSLTSKLFRLLHIILILYARIENNYTLTNPRMYYPFKKGLN